MVCTYLEESRAYLLGCIPLRPKEVVYDDVEVAIVEQFQPPCTYSRIGLVDGDEIIMHEVHPQLVEIALPGVREVVVWGLCVKLAIVRPVS